MQNKLYQILAYAGSIPFIACACAALMSVEEIYLLGNPTTIVTSYGLAIVSFMAGVHWGTYLYQRCPLNLFISSNIVTLATWIAFLIASDFTVVVVQTMAFLYLLFIDMHLKRADVIHPDYFKTRIIVTMIVTVSLIFIAISV